MKKILLALCFLSLRIFSQTTIPGGYVYGTWTLAGSPYLVQGSLMIPNDSTLTIQPGVTVNFQGHYKLYVAGRLLAMGTQTDSIFFTAANTTTGWYGIRFDTTHVTNDTSRFSYCSLTYAIANGPGYDAVGAAFYFNGFSKAVISNCLMKNCTSTWNSSPGNLGAIITCMNNSSPYIINNSIMSNKGTGISFQYSSPKISNNTIAYNTSSGNSDGTGIMAWFSNPIIYNNAITHNSGSGICFDGGTITNNTVSFNGPAWFGAVYVNYYSGATSIISHNNITNNIASAGGSMAGGLNISTNSLTCTYNIIANNSAVSGPGGIGVYGGNNCVISNNLIANNSSTTTASSNFSAGGVSISNSSPAVSNNTIVNNRSAYGGGVSFYNSSSPAIYNSIIYGNTVVTNTVQVNLVDQTSQPGFYYCDVEGGTAAFNLNGNFYTGNYISNINSSPMFVAPSGGSGTGFNGATADWMLQITSPCVDAGNPSGSYPATDLANNPRVVGSRIDIGAYEFQGTSDITNFASQNGLSLFPNPASDFFIVTPATSTEKQTLEIYNINGVLVISKDIRSKTICDISMLEAGVYTLVIKSGGTRTADKLVIVH